MKAHHHEQRNQPYERLTSEQTEQVIEAISVALEDAALTIDTVTAGGHA
ncbi:hypothetical protein ccbrp13_36240 [Ktedonobacteria bacterium brp13]|nr:hypothetical protein ccbrp13_36240 [Ktedonobacteria bacterium brp13]